jgi:hypothetical protein
MTTTRRLIYIVFGVALIVAIVYSMRMPKAFSKTTWVWGDKKAAAIHLPIEPHGLALFVAEDNSADSKQLINEVVAVWPELWPKMRAYLDIEMKGYGLKTVLGRDEFIGSLGRMTPDVYMGDQSDIMIRLEFEEPPVWDFFVRGSTIAHSQPVF